MGLAGVPSAARGMTSFADGPKSTPHGVVRQVLDGVESGAGEVLADDFTRQAKAEPGTQLAVGHHCEPWHTTLYGASWATMT